MSFFKEFKAFISKGNILDMAVGVIIGGAFNTIVQTLNKQILMPIVNWALSNVPGSENGLYTIMINSQELNTTGLTPEQISIAQAAATLGPDGKYYTVLNYINWNALFESIINFLFIALTLFIIVKVTKYISSKRIKLAEILKLKEEEEKAAEPEPESEPDPQIVLLTEIRDALKAKEINNEAKPE